MVEYAGVAIDLVDLPGESVLMLETALKISRFLSLRSLTTSNMMSRRALSKCSCTDTWFQGRLVQGLDGHPDIGVGVLDGQGGDLAMAGFATHRPTLARSSRIPSISSW